ncbi:urea transporter [Brevibacillus ruminantium]|uniref:Urea transporter n=1 Tax=Brevibacillus ruminantium TaxID=2950604 RepID=A0ABY4WD88_9BACL|nr:urea transporter [Brevibacillus ruminantium]USG65032.1 urea transporter [Brevibacillus ruminantium]
MLLIENAISGVLILAGITIADYRLGIISFVSAWIGAWMAYAGGADKAAVAQGLFGYNAVLSGLALSLFLSGGQRWWIALAGAAISVFVTAAVMYMMRGTDVPALTFPYIILTWFLLLIPYHLGFFEASSELVPQDLAHATFHQEGTIQLLDGLIDGIGQVYFQQGVLTSLLILVAIFWAGWRLGLYAVIGTVVGWLTAFLLNAEITLLNLGLYGYNAVLTILAVSAVFATDHRMATLTGILAAIITVPVTAGLSSWLQPYGLPTLTMPFVLVTWMFIAARKELSRM